MTQVVIMTHSRRDRERERERERKQKQDKQTIKEREKEREREIAQWWQRVMESWYETLVYLFKVRQLLLTSHGEPASWI